MTVWRLVNAAEIGGLDAVDAVVASGHAVPRAEEDPPAARHLNGRRRIDVAAVPLPRLEQRMPGVGQQVKRAGLPDRRVKRPRAHATHDDRIRLSLARNLRHRDHARRAHRRCEGKHCRNDRRKTIGLHASLLVRRDPKHKPNRAVAGRTAAWHLAPHTGRVRGFVIPGAAPVPRACPGLRASAPGGAWQLFNLPGSRSHAGKQMHQSRDLFPQAAPCRRARASVLQPDRACRVVLQAHPGFRQFVAHEIREGVLPGFLRRLAGADQDVHELVRELGIPASGRSPRTAGRPCRACPAAPWMRPHSAPISAPSSAACCLAYACRFSLSSATASNTMPIARCVLKSSSIASVNASRSSPHLPASSPSAAFTGLHARDLLRGLHRLADAPHRRRRLLQRGAAVVQRMPVVRREQEEPHRRGRYLLQHLVDA